MTVVGRWLGEPVRSGLLAKGVVPRYAVLVLLVWAGSVEAVLLGVLPALGHSWFYDHWRIGGTLPLIGAMCLGGYVIDRRFGPDGKG